MAVAKTFAARLQCAAIARRPLMRIGGGGSHQRTCLCCAFPCCGGKYREFRALEAGYGEAALALANKFKCSLRIP